MKAPSRNSDRSGHIVAAGLALAYFVLVSLAPVASAQQRRPPNIVLILADDLGINDLSCYGRGEHQTRALDRLASEGTLFTSAYCAQPICSPSRAALLSGNTPARLHLTNYLPGRPDAPSQRLLQPTIAGQLPLEEVTLAELLSKAGYATGCFGKWHLGGMGFSPREQGFDTAFLAPENSEPSATEGGKSEFAITEAAENFIEANAGRPFFCYVPHHNPHIVLRASAQRIAAHKGAFNPTYAAMLETLDESVGRLLEKVKSLGLEQQTIVIFASDNGGLHVLESPDSPSTHNSPYRAGKGFLYEGGIRIPLIVRWPGEISARVCGTPVILTDIMPTLLEFAGIDAAKTIGPLDGMSLAALLKKGEEPTDRPLFWHFPHYTNQGSRPAGAIRQGDYKLIEHLEDGQVELYHLTNDPGETTNLAEREKDLAGQLLLALRNWRASVGAVMPSRNPEFDAALHAKLYVEQDPSRFARIAEAASLDPKWKTWRTAMNQAVSQHDPMVTPASGDIRLLAQDAVVHGKLLRYEPEPHKNVLGYWTNEEDWAHWEFSVPKTGIYEVELQLGCGTGSGGAQVAVNLGETTFLFTVPETGHFQKMILKTVGSLKLEQGPGRLELRPTYKPGVAVMDVRRIVLRPLDSR